MQLTHIPSVGDVESTQGHVQWEISKCRTTRQGWTIRKVDCNTSVLRVDFHSRDVQCVSNCACVKFLTQQGLGSDPNHGTVPRLPHLQHAYLQTVLLSLCLCLKHWDQLKTPYSQNKTNVTSTSDLAICKFVQICKWLPFLRKYFKYNFLK